MRIKQSIISALLLLCAVFPLQGKGYTYECIGSSIYGGNRFTCIHATDRGFVWGGSTKGIYRFGYYAGHWYIPEEDGGKFPGTEATGFCDTPSGTVIVIDKGAFLYDFKLDSFLPVMLSEEGRVLSEVRPHSFAVMKDGTVLAGGDGVLYVYDSVSNTLKVESAGKIPVDFKIDKIFEGQNGCIYLVNMEQGAYTYHSKGDFFTEEALSLSSNTAFFVDHKGNLWRSDGNGLECYDPSINLIARYTVSNSYLSSDRVCCVLEKNEHLWIGTSYGVNILNMETGGITSYARDQHSFASFPCTATIDMTLSADGSLWALQDDGSVVVLRESFARSFPVGEVFDNNGRCSDEILCASKSVGDQVMYVGTAYSGLFTYHYDYDHNNASILSIPSTAKMRVESLLDLEDGRLLMSCGEDGFFLFEKKNGAISRLKTVPACAGSEVCRDDAGRVLLLSDAIYVWNPHNGAVVSYQYGNASQFGRLHQVLQSGGKYYFGDHCLCSWDSGSNTFELAYDFGPDITINDAAGDLADSFWIVTDKGLYNYDEVFANCNRCDSPLFTSARAVACDKRGRVWIGTHNSLYVYMPQTESFINIGMSYGVNWNNYSPRSSIITPDTRVIMGGTNGFVTIDTDISFKKTETPEIILSDIVVNDDKVTIGTYHKLRSFENNITIECFVRESDILRRKSFKFLIDNGSHVEEAVQSEPRLELKNLGSGEYRISACCTLQNGEWSAPALLTTFVINEVWYRSIPFWLIMLALTLIVALFIVRAIIHEAELKRQADESRHAAKLEQDSVRFLLNVSHELKTPLTLIISPLNRILKRKSKDDPEYRTLTNVFRQAMRMKTLILTVLDAHKIQSNSAVLNAEPVEFNAWAEALVADFDEEADYRGIRLVRKYDSRIANVNLDAPKLENVITNLLINAMKHSPNDTNITVGTKLLEGGKFVRFFVSDQGEGLGGVDMTKLFSRYYQGVTEKTGSGMGLAYANSIVGLHGGSMGAADNVEGGATFYFDVPAPSES